MWGVFVLIKHSQYQHLSFIVNRADYSISVHMKTRSEI